VVTNNCQKIKEKSSRNVLLIVFALSVVNGENISLLVLLLVQTLNLSVKASSQV